MEVKKIKYRCTECKKIIDLGKVEVEYVDDGETEEWSRFFCPHCGDEIIVDTYYGDFRGSQILPEKYIKY